MTSGTSTITVQKNSAIADIPPRIFGSFVEHLGRCVYGGIYEPSHPTADENGFRQDVINLVKELGVTCVRYPGGNFVSAYNWEDGTGPRGQRPIRRDLAWHSTETNEVGIDDFYRWSKKTGTEIMLAVNMGTRGLKAALEELEYVNGAPGTELADRRVRNGITEPMDIKMWCIGNEMDGPWQVGHMSPDEYAAAVDRVAHAMKLAESGLELVACGSSSSEMPTFGSWEYEMLDECYDNIDYISLHRYYGHPTNSTEDFLAQTMDMDDFIRSVIALCDAVKGKKHARKFIHLSFDEWNLCYHSGEQDNGKKPERWGRAPALVEDVYNFEDALLTGSILITFLRHADRVKIACLAQLVNVIAPILTRDGGGCWAQTTYYPFQHMSRYARGTSLLAAVDSPCYDCKDYEKVPYLDAAATRDEDGTVTVFCVNRHQQEDFTLDVDLHGMGDLRVGEHILLHHDNVKAANTEDAPYTVYPTQGPGGMVDGEKATLRIPALSWNVIRFVPVEK